MSTLGKLYKSEEKRAKVTLRVKGNEEEWIDRGDYDALDSASIVSELTTSLQDLVLRSVRVTANAEEDDGEKKMFAVTVEAQENGDWKDGGEGYGWKNDFPFNEEGLASECKTWLEDLGLEVSTGEGIAESVSSDKRDVVRLEIQQAMNHFEFESEEEQWKAIESFLDENYADDPDLEEMKEMFFKEFNGGVEECRYAAEEKATGKKKEEFEADCDEEAARMFDEWVEKESKRSGKSVRESYTLKSPSGKLLEAKSTKKEVLTSEQEDAIKKLMKDVHGIYFEILSVKDGTATVDTHSQTKTGRWRITSDGRVSGKTH